MPSFASRLIPAGLALGYTVLAVWFPFLPNSNRSLDVRQFAPSMPAGLAYASLIAILFGLCWLAYRITRQGQGWTMPGVMGLTLLFGTPLLLVYPINANDVYNYWGRGRLTVHYQANPFITPPDAFPDDPYLPMYGEWVDVTTPYGPVWELVSAGVYGVTGGQLAAGVIGFKFLGLLAHLATGWVIWQMGATLPAGERLGRAVLWWWNPALLLMFVVDAHNDSLMLLWLTLGIWQGERRPWLGWLILLLAPLTKLIGALALPFYLLAWWRQQPNLTARGRLTGLALLSGALVVGAFFWPFGSPQPLIERLLAESQAGGSFSPLVFLILIGRGLQMTFSIDPLVQSFTIAFGLVGLGLVGWALRGRPLARSLADIFTAYIVTAFSFRIWYPTWVWPWLLLDPAGAGRRRWGFWFLLTSQLSVVIYGHMRAAWLGGLPLLTYAIAIPFVFGLPLLAAYGRSEKSIM